MDLADFQRKLDSGADLVQIYTGLIYKGPALIVRIINADWFIDKLPQYFILKVNNYQV